MLDIIGIIGVVMMLGAYFLLQAERITSKQYIYPVLNFVSAGLIVISLMGDWNLSAFLIEVSWMVVSLYGIIKIYRGAYGRR